MSKLITARDFAERDGMHNVESWLRKLSVENGKRFKFPVWDGRLISGTPVQAFVDFGRWVAQCDLCGSAIAVDPDVRVFFCMRCGNNNTGMARPVIFPAEWEQVEDILMERPVLDDPHSRNRVEKARNSRPIIDGLVRNWHPVISIEELRGENERLLPKRGAE
jgi:hypothetical protein